MSKRALLIGINYLNTPSAQLYGCIFDIIQIKSLLIDVYGFAEKDIIMLRDDDPSKMPTKQRIMNECMALVNANASQVFLHYSGHGTNIKDTNGDEKDRMDECIVPCDYKTAGILADDDLSKILRNIRSSGIALFDCCHSGTILDLPNEQINNAITTPTTNGLFCFSGCLDSQLASETFSVTTGLPQGAATAAFIAVLRRLKYYPTIIQLYNELKIELKANGFEQVPHLTSNVQITAGNQYPIQRSDSSGIQIANLKTELAKATAQNRSNTAIISSLQTQIVASKNQEVVYKKQITSLMNQIKPIQNQLHTYIVRIASVNGLNDRLKQQVTTLQQQITKLTAKK